MRGFDFAYLNNNLDPSNAEGLDPDFRSSCTCDDAVYTDSVQHDEYCPLCDYEEYCVLCDGHPDDCDPDLCDPDLCDVEGSDAQGVSAGYSEARVGAVIDFDNTLLLNLRLADDLSWDLTVACDNLDEMADAVEMFSMWLNLGSLIQVTLDPVEGVSFTDHTGMGVTFAAPSPAS